MKINELVDKYLNSHQIKVVFDKFDPFYPPEELLWEDKIRMLSYTFPKTMIKEYLKIKNSGNLFPNLYSLSIIGAEQFWKDLKLTERLKEYKGKKEYEQARNNLIKVEEFLHQKADIKYKFIKKSPSWSPNHKMLVVYRQTKQKSKT